MKDIYNKKFETMKKAMNVLPCQENGESSNANKLVGLILWKLSSYQNQSINSSQPSSKSQNNFHRKWKHMWKYKISWVARIILTKKNSAGDTIIPDF